MSDSTEVQPDSATETTPVDTKGAPSDAAAAANDVPAAPASESTPAEQPQPKAVEEPQSGGGWASWFQRVRKSAEEAVAICKHDLLEMTTQIKEDTTEAVESLSTPQSLSCSPQLFTFFSLVHPSHTEIDTKAHMENVTTAVDHVIGTVASTLAAVPQMLTGEQSSSSPAPADRDTHPLKFVTFSIEVCGSQ